MTTKQAAKVVQRLYAAAENMVDDAGEGSFDPIGADLKTDIDRLRETLPEAKQALEVLSRRFP